MLIIEKVKRPGGVYVFEAIEIGEDEFGTWLYTAAGTTWRSPNQSGTVPVHFVGVFSSARPGPIVFAEGSHVSFDVGLPPERTDRGWRYVDLELDPIIRPDGTVEIEDEDEFEEACRAGWIDESAALLARRVADEAVEALKRGDEPYATVGFAWLEAAIRSREG